MCVAVALRQAMESEVETLKSDFGALMEEHK